MEDARGHAEENGPSAARRTIVVARDLGEVWLALLEDGRVVELTVRPVGQGRLLGAILKGRVSRVASGVHAAFVAIGQARDAFVPLDDDREPPREGDEVLLQVVREAQGAKGPRATFDVTLPGWALVLAPRRAQCGVSRKIVDQVERERLRALVEELAPEGFGLVARTAATGLGRDELRAERDELLARWNGIAARAAESRPPTLVHREDDPGVVFVRDHLAGGLEAIVVDGEAEEFARRLGERGEAARVAPHVGPLPAVEAYGLEQAARLALAAEAPLPGGGWLALQSTEALTAIDVNSGADTSAANLEETALRTNLEAAEEIPRQLRLRDVGGLVVVDFIDMDAAADRAKVNAAFAAALSRDRAKLRVLPLTDFHLAQITRERRRLPLEKILGEPCPCCRRGVVLRPEAAARDLLREARRRARPLPRARIVLEAPETVAAAGREILELWGEASGFDRTRPVVWRVGERSVRIES